MYCGPFPHPPHPAAPGTFGSSVQVGIMLQSVAILSRNKSLLLHFMSHSTL